MARFIVCDRYDKKIKSPDVPSVWTKPEGGTVELCPSCDQDVRALLAFPPAGGGTGAGNGK